MSWNGLFEFLGHFDPQVPLYMGSPVAGSYGRWFAHGGSGFVLSDGAVKKFLNRRVGIHGEYTEPGIVSKYADMVVSDCCGDAVMAYAMVEKGITLDGYYPLFSGDNREGSKIHAENWCIPVISLHHVSAEEMPKIWSWEMGRGNNEVTLFRTKFCPYGSKLTSRLRRHPPSMPTFMNTSIHIRLEGGTTGITFQGENRGERVLIILWRRVRMRAWRMLHVYNTHTIKFAFLMTRYGLGLNRK